MKVLLSIALSFFLIACGEINGNKIILEIKPEGYFIEGNEVKDLGKYFQDIENSAELDLIILASVNAKTDLLVRATEYANLASFKNINLSSVKD